MKKSFPERCRDYYLDNPNGYWFKRKLYGLGWVPVRSQGWVTILVFVALLIANALRFEGRLDAGKVVPEFLLSTAALVLLLLAICYRTGESLKWQWGPPDEEKDHTEPR